VKEVLTCLFNHPDIRNCGPNTLGIRGDPSFFGVVDIPSTAAPSEGRYFWDCDMWDHLARNTSISDLDMEGSLKKEQEADDLAFSRYKAAYDTRKPPLPR
jgi:hypothetical protein